MAEHEATALREVVGALVFPGSAKKSSIDRDLLWNLVVAGLEIHVAAEDASEQFSRSTLSLMCDRRILTRMVGSWREGVVSRGPARAAAVARVANDARASCLAMLGDLRWSKSLVRAAGAERF